MMYEHVQNVNTPPHPTPNPTFVGRYEIGLHKCVGFDWNKSQMEFPPLGMGYLVTHTTVGFVSPNAYWLVSLSEAQELGYLEVNGVDWEYG